MSPTDLQFESKFFSIFFIFIMVGILIPAKIPPDHKTAGSGSEFPYWGESYESLISRIFIINITEIRNILYVQEVVTQPKILNRTILYNLVHVT